MTGALTGSPYDLPHALAAESPPDGCRVHFETEAFALVQRPTPEEPAGRAERWRPFRSYAASLL